MLSLRAVHAVLNFSLVFSFLPHPVSLCKSPLCAYDALAASAKSGPFPATRDADNLDSPMRSPEDSLFLLPFSSLSLSR